MCWSVVNCGLKPPDLFSGEKEKNSLLKPLTLGMGYSDSWILASDSFLFFGNANQGLPYKITIYKTCNQAVVKSMSLLRVRFSLVQP
jgi:hypothetical protein